MKRTTVFIADDHPIFRKGLAAVLSISQNLELVGEAGDGREALEKMEQHPPEIAILDLEMPVMSGFKVARTLKERGLFTKVIFLTMHSEEALFNRAVDMGVKGWVLKENASEEILNAVDAVKNDRYFVSKEVAGFLAARQEGGSIAAASNLLEALTPAEMRVLTLLSKGKSNREMAEETGLSVKTIENHRASICRKLNIEGSFALSRWVQENAVLLKV